MTNQTPRFAIGQIVRRRNGRRFTITAIPTDYKDNGCDVYEGINSAGTKTSTHLERDIESV